MIQQLIEMTDRINESYNIDDVKSEAVRLAHHLSMSRILNIVLELSQTQNLLEIQRDELNKFVPQNKDELKALLVHRMELDAKKNSHEEQIRQFLKSVSNN